MGGCPSGVLSKLHINGNKCYSAVIILELWGGVFWQRYNGGGLEAVGVRGRWSAEGLILVVVSLLSWSNEHRSDLVEEADTVGMRLLGL